MYNKNKIKNKMIGNFGKIAPIIRIKNFPSRENVINDFKSFMTERKYKENYKIIYKPNSIFLKVNNPSIAYKYNERFSNKIMANPLFQNSKCSLIFQKPKKDLNTLNISHNYSHIKPKLYLPKNSHTKNTFLNKSASVIGEYERKHWAHIRNKACIIDNDSPYMDMLTKEYLEKKDNEKKWVVKKNFDVFVGKASSQQSHNCNDIKNYVRRTPSLPPILYQFRRNEKNKWLVKSDFQLY